MAGPWEDYAAQAPAAAQPEQEGPWTQFAAPQTGSPTASSAKDLSYRSKILPFSRDAQGSVHFDLSAGLTGALVDAFTLPGDVATGKTQVMGDDGHVSPEVMNRAMELAATAGPLSAANRILGTVATPSREALQEAAKQGFEKARNMGVEFNSGAVGNMASAARAQLEGKGIIAELAPDTFSVLSKLETPPPGSVAPLSGLEAARRSFGHIRGNFNNPTDQTAAGQAVAALDRFTAQPPEGAVLAGPASEAARVLTDARANYAAAKRSEQVADAIEAARYQAGAANSGQNVGNATRQKFKSILLSDKNSSGFSPEEIAQMDKVVMGTGLANLGRGAGNALGGGGGIGATVAAAIGESALPGVGRYAPAVGSGIKRIADALLNSQVSKLDNMVRARSPVAEALLAGGRPVVDLSPSQALIARALLSTIPPALLPPDDEQRANRQ